jgi:hypothetical protein
MMLCEWNAIPQETVMKRGFAFATMLALTAAPLFASPKPETVHIAEALMLGSTQLAPGDYKVTWVGTGPIVHITLTSGKTSVSADAKLVTTQSGNSSVMFTTRGDQKILEEIDLRHATLQLQNPEVAEK